MIKYTLEFPIKSSVSVLFNAVSTPDGLSEWFADNVNWSGNIYTFIWDDSEEEAELLKKINNQLIRFRWLEEDEETFFEFKIEVDPVTNDVTLFVTDFAENEDEKENSTNLWEAQVNALMKRIGS
ncbi:MAG: hypothetical protein CMP74_00045 [Flavobacteriales bacterium]|nr:hypothetical protein [Flavobacteriales bacterium]|tara:strand:- start:1629 stop:2003 length:375 start_codon:yes stop_codon:yes gene_type:complete